MTENHDFMSSGRQLGRVNCCVISFSAAVGEKRFLQTPGRNLREFLSQVRLWLITVESRSVRDRVDLIDDGFIHFRISMSDAYRQHAAKAIQVFVSPVVPDIKTFAAH